MICLADMVLVQPDDYRQLIGIFAQAPIEDHPANVVRHDFNHDRFCTDMDTRTEYESIRTRLISQTLA